MMSRYFLNAGLATALLASGAAAQQALPPARPLGPMEHESTMGLRSISEARALPGGRVLVNDIVDHRVLLFDSTLTTATAVADTTASTANAYGNRPGGLIPFHGDSTLFVDPASLSMLVFDGNGKVGRVLAVPRPSESMFLIGGPYGEPGFDPAGHLVYRGGELIMSRPPAGGDLKNFAPQFPDSAPIVRLNIATRAEDTVAFFKLAPTKMSVTRTDNGIMAQSIVNPMPIVDTWALMPDGTVAVVRGSDFHVDFYHLDGTHTSSPKVPFNWERLTDSSKAAVLDSAKQAMEATRAARVAALDSTRKLSGGQNQIIAGDPAAGLGAAGQMVFSIRTGGPDGGGGGAPRQRGGNPSSSSMPSLPGLKFVEPYELPDYRPAFTAASAMSDADGHVWIRTTDAQDGAPIYDVVSGTGALVDRVQLPRFRRIAGFGPGVVYMGVADSTGAIHLERARIK